MSALALSPPTIDFAGVSLNLPADATEEEWTAVGAQLFGAQRNVQWLIGDWWAYGEDRFETRAKDIAAKLLKRKPGTIYNLGTVARRFGTSFRNETLTFAHHAQLTPLEDEEAAQLLQLTAENKWTVRELREEIQRRRAVEIVQQTTAPSRPFDYALRCLARLVGAFVDLDPAEFIGSSKGTQAQVNARQMVMYLLLTDADFREIDIANGLGRHHSTVDHAVEKFTALREETEIDDALTRLGETYRLFRNTQAAAGLIAEMTA